MGNIGNGISSPPWPQARPSTNTPSHRNPHDAKLEEVYTGHCFKKEFTPHAAFDFFLPKIVLVRDLSLVFFSGVKPFAALLLRSSGSSEYLGL